MLVLVDPQTVPDAAPFGRSLQAALGASILLETGRMLPLSSSFEASCRVLEALSERYHEADVGTVVVLLSPEIAGRASEVAFWLQRYASQRVYRIGAAEGPRDAVKWGPWAADRVQCDDDKFRLKPWQPDVPRIETPRLLLTAPTAEQTEGYYHEIIGTDIFDTLCWDGPGSVEELWAWDQMSLRRFARGKAAAANFAILDRKSGKRIGGCSWRPGASGLHRGDLGYVLSKPWQGQGLGKEAIGGLVDWVFSSIQPERVEAWVFVGNERSRKLLEALGFELEATCPARERKSGRSVDEWLFGLTRLAWERRRTES